MSLSCIHLCSEYFSLRAYPHFAAPITKPCFVLKEPDAKQRTRNRVHLLESKESAVGRPRGLVEAVAGGQSLAALLIYYCHHEFGFKGTCAIVLI